MSDVLMLQQALEQSDALLATTKRIIDEVIKVLPHYGDSPDSVADCVAKLVMERDGLKHDLKELVDQLKKWHGEHLYNGPDCVFCGHFGPADDPNDPCNNPMTRMGLTRDVYLNPRK
jgi:hypothetical protein